MISQHEELSGLIRVLRYYAFFHYAATFNDIYMSYPYEVSTSQMESILRTAHTEGRILTEKIDGTGYYTMPSHGISLHEVARKIETTKQKQDRVYPFIYFSKYIPSVYLIGLSGSLAMQNAGKNDDVDFFIISAPGQVWTTRLLLLLLASLLGMRRKRGERSPSGKVCLNLFFDGADLTVPANKQNLYVAHEIVQMKPQFVRGKMYERFLEANGWISEFFPNFDGSRGLSQSSRRSELSLDTHFSNKWGPPLKTGTPVVLQTGIFAPFFSVVEKLAKTVQLYLMRGHITNELVSNTQMWFYPDDFENKLRKSKMLAD